MSVLTSFLSLLLRLTVSIEASLSDNMRLIDLNGNPHPMTKFQVRMMMLIGWLAFLSAALMNILFYKVHPSFVDFSPKRFQNKCFIYFFGRKKVFFKGGGKEEIRQLTIDELESLNRIIGSQRETTL